MRKIDRFDEYMKNQHLNDNQVSKQLGLANGVIGKSRQAGRDLSQRVIELIEKCYKNLNINWLSTGEGSMLKEHTLVQFADRLSEIIIDLNGESLPNIAEALGIKYEEIGQFTNNLIFPQTPFDFVKFLKEYPEYNLKWILTGVGEKFNGDEELCLKNIKERIYRKKNPKYFSDEQKPSINDKTNTGDSGKLWQHMAFLGEQLKEKDSQIKQLLDILQKK